MGTGIKKNPQEPQIQYEQREPRKQRAWNRKQKSQEPKTPLGFCSSWLLADDERFELSEVYSLTRFRVVLLRPLGQSSFAAERNLNIMPQVHHDTQVHHTSVRFISVVQFHSSTVPLLYQRALGTNRLGTFSQA